MSTPDNFRGFVGTWILKPETCEYEQGEPPVSGVYRIAEDGDHLVFTIDWTDAEADEHHVEFSGVPDGTRVAFSGGDLADALSVTAVSPRELNSAAYYKGVECMFAQRQLDASGMAMRVTQVIRFTHGARLANVSVYVRAQ